MFFSFSEFGFPFPVAQIMNLLFGLYCISLGTLWASYRKFGNYDIHRNQETLDKLLNL